MRRAYRTKPHYVYVLSTRDEQRHEWNYHSTVTNKRTAEGMREGFARYGIACKIERKKV